MLRRIAESGLLQHMLGTFVHLTIASSLVVCAACDSGPAALDAAVGQPDGGAADASAASDWIAADCAAGSQPRVLAHVRFKRRLDYAALFSSFPSGTLPMTGAFPAGTQLLEAVGEPCASAGSLTECTATLMQLERPGDACVGERSCAPFLVTTQGNRVVRADLPAELIALLGSVDSATKAELIVAFNGHTLACPLNTAGQYFSGTQVRPDPDGYEVRTEWQLCNAPAFSETLHVDRDGTLIALDNRILAPTSCFSGP